VTPTVHAAADDPCANNPAPVAEKEFLDFARWGVAQPRPAASTTRLTATSDNGADRAGAVPCLYAGPPVESCQMFAPIDHESGRRSDEDGQPVGGEPPGPQLLVFLVFRV
jgi:hypothetical protein